MSQRSFRILIFISCVLLGLGLFGPCMTIVPRFGEFTFLIKVLKPDFGVLTTVSIWDGIIALLQGEHLFLGLFLLLFSVVFPLWKLGALWEAIETPVAELPARKSLKLISRLGKFSMIDIFVIALIVLALKGLPGGSAIKLHWGVAAFALSILLSMKIILLLERDFGHK